MAVSFDFNFWTLSFVLLNFALAIFGIIEARSRASAEQMERQFEEIKRDLEAFKTRHGEIELQQSQRIRSVESRLDGAVSLEDVSAVHRRVDEIHRMMSEMNNTLGMVKGILEGWRCAPNIGGKSGS